MERIIKSILNYDVRSSTKEKRDELTANITALSLFLLEKTNYFDVPNHLKIESAKMGGGSYGEGLMKLSETAFLDSTPHAFANDITNVAHEVCHYAQEHSKNASDNIISGRSFNYTPERFEPMFFFIVQFFYPKYFGTLQMLGPKIVADMNDDLAMFYDYFFSFYELQSYEVEANKFSVEVLKYIVQTADKMQLSEKERRNLQTIKESIPLVKTYDYKVEHYKKLRQDPRVVRKVRGAALKTLEQLFRCTDFVDTLNSEGAELIPDTISQVVLDVACQYLELNYDEQFAKHVMNMLLKAKPGEVRDRYLFQLAFWTPYNFNESEEKQIKDILSKTNIDIKKLSYEEIVSEKQRIVAEREDMMRNRHKPVREFKFE
ncbi:MAG: hypothetical protein IKD36_02090 [Clostridia bacterium]|nr:hypothetical protein [Clostridia bacterium]